MATEKKCTSPACYANETKVSTDRETCVFCDKPLIPATPIADFGDLLGGLFGQR